MDKKQFEAILTEVCQQLTMRSVKTVFTKAKDFENAVRDELEKLVVPHGIHVDYDPHPHVFPDITIGDFGVEVKFTKSDTWRSIANSVNESRRDQSVKHIYLVFGKMGFGRLTPKSEVRWADYESSVIHVRTSHMPRFEVEIGKNKSIFKEFGVSYDGFRKLNVSEKMELIRKYTRSRLKAGERMWWLEGEEGEEEHAIDISVRLYTQLKTPEKRMLRAEAALLCPQIVKDSSVRGKYDDAILFIMTYHGVLCHQGRDLFTAGSVSPKKYKTQCGGNQICMSLTDIQSEIIEAAIKLDEKLFIEFWGQSIDGDPRLRLSKWLRILDSYARNWQPSKQLQEIAAYIND